MPGLYDHLESHLGEERKTDTKIYEQIVSQLDDESAGLSPADLIGMPGDQKKILLFFLRDTEATMQGVTQEILEQKLKEPPPNLPDLLKKLSDDGWLIVMGESPHFRYRIHMRRKPGSQLGFGIWSMIGQHLSKGT